MPIMKQAIGLYFHNLTIHERKFICMEWGCFVCNKKMRKNSWAFREVLK